MAQLQLSPAVWLQTQALSSVGLLWSWAFFGNIIDCSVAQVCLVSDSATPWTVACQAPWSMKFSRQEYWSGLPFPTLGDLPDQGIKPKSLASPALAGRFFITAPPGKPINRLHISKYNSNKIDKISRRNIENVNSQSKNKTSGQRRQSAVSDTL